MSGQQIKVEIRPSYVLRNGRDVRDGWDVFVNGVWHERFQRKSHAQLEARTLRRSA